MLIQVGPCSVSLSINQGGSFDEIFDAVDATINVEYGFIDRINDGVVVESEVSSLSCTYEITSLKWSTVFLETFMIADYSTDDSGPGPGEIVRSHLFDVLGLTNIDPFSHAISLKAVPEAYLRFIPRVIDKASYVDLPRARLNGSIPFSFGSDQSTINISGVALKDETNGLVKVKLNDCVLI